MIDQATLTPCEVSTTSYLLYRSLMPCMLAAEAYGCDDYMLALQGTMIDTEDFEYALRYLCGEDLSALAEEKCRRHQA